MSPRGCRCPFWSPSGQRQAPCASEAASFSAAAITCRYVLAATSSSVVETRECIKSQKGRKQMQGLQCFTDHERCFPSCSNITPNIAAICSLVGIAEAVFRERVLYAGIRVWTSTSAKLDRSTGHSHQHLQKSRHRAQRQQTHEAKLQQPSLHKARVQIARRNCCANKKLIHMGYKRPSFCCPRHRRLAEGRVQLPETVHLLLGLLP